MSLTKMGACRKITAGNTSKEIEKIIENLKIILSQKETQELELMEEVNRQESIRLEAAKVYEDNGVAVPEALKIPITLDTLLKKPKKKASKLDNHLSKGKKSSAAAETE